MFVSSVIAYAGIVTGTVTLPNFSGSTLGISGTATITDGINSETHDIVLNDIGDYSFTTSLSGYCVVVIKCSHWLAQTIYCAEFTDDINIGTVYLMKNGDVVDNNEVDFSDINAVRAAYGSFPGDETWNERADVDGSGEVDFTDINLVRINYGEMGDTTEALPPSEMIYIPAGSFLMGNSSLDDDASYGSLDEFPQHLVTLSDYWIGKYEVTRGEYRQFMNAGGYSNSSYWSTEGWSWKVSNNRTEPAFWAESQNWGTGTFIQSDNHPIVGVTYYEAEAFCNWAGGYLPTEEQWERAARWNVSSNHPNVYPWGNTWNQEYCNNSYDNNFAGGGYSKYQTASMGSYSDYPSPSGCQDMAGNVWEWCQDWYKSYNESTSPFDYTNDYRVLRGGGWFSAGDGYRCAYRYGNSPYSFDTYYGFRLAC